ncbi:MULTISPECIES: ABC transporter permease [Actinoalloteichus]|uniref:ABC-type nitrate/sulfonate/bicarbonate transport system, permease component n=1 Tax=Actinoalloteichus fjordicus TaxID=1612552 RepID=A0AAC9LHZ3_9PSEU|nr:MULTISPECIES: ABC transporter permease [Actinoalloteichus]APU17696.1 ABC-type nitrate/sulfonate/bicarbonate transport system, permease component [Actinoalloteichus fjordicus]APU23774.1 ABC-type nitrate/sulfonate/bicarbonate transport system, permease component [Actinoalloteichus sp. GBA129-24]
MRSVLRGLVGLAGFLALCEIVGRSGLVPSYYLPPPSVVLTTLGGLLVDQSFLMHVVATVLAWLIAMGIAVGIAVPAGLLLGSVKAVRVATRSVIEFLRPIPSVALIPLALVLLGTGPETKIALAVYAAIWPIMFNTIYALDEMDSMMIDTARSFRLGRLRTLATVALPNSAPFIATGIRVAASIALILVISTELLAGGRVGLGVFILEASSSVGRMDVVLAGTVVAGAVGYLTNELLERAQRRWLGWDNTVEAVR